MNRLAIIGGLAAGLLLLGGCATSPGVDPAPSAAGPSQSAAGPSQSAAPDAASTPLDGTYRVDWTADELFQALDGSGEPEAADIANGNWGEIHVAFEAGRYDITFVRLGESCPGTFVVEGDRVVMTATTNPAEWDCGDGVGQLAADAAWTLDGPTLTLSDWNLSPDPALDWHNAVLLGTKPLERQS